MTTPEDGTSRRSLALVAAGVVAVTAALYARVVTHGFIAMDDPYYVFGNATVLRGLSSESLSYAFSLDGRSSYFHPATWLSLMLDAQVLGPEPSGFHLVNLLLHLCTVTLLLLLLRRLTGSTLGAAAGALLFAVHPLTVEAVAWISERKTVLSSAFGVASILAWVSYAKRPGWRRYVLSLALHAAGLLAKPGLVVLPFLLLLLDAWPLGRLDDSSDGAAPASKRRHIVRLLLEKLPFVACSVAVTLAVIHSASASTAHFGAGAVLGTRTLHAIAIIPEYLKATVFPMGLAIFHPYPRLVDPGRVLLGGAVVLALTGGTLACARRFPWALVGWLWFLVALTPYLGLHQAGLWPARADRFVYVPLMGLALALAGGIARMRAGHARVVIGLSGAVAVALGAVTAGQLSHWRDSVAVFERAVAIEPDSGPMNVRLGISLLSEARAAEAVAPLQRAIELSPAAAADANFHLGRAFEALRQDGRAEQSYGTAIQLNPSHYPALFAYAEMLTRIGLGAQARLYYARFLAVAPADGSQERQVAESRLR